MLKQILDDAAGKGLVTPAQVDPLYSYLTGHGVTVPAAVAQDVLRPSADEIVDTESPRFLRGFHDVLISIGVLILLAGLSGLWSPVAMLPFIIVLSEILVARQRLALPAVLLSGAMLIWTAVAAYTAIDFAAPDAGAGAKYLLLFLAYPVVMGLFYWRYRVPIALAFLIISAFLVLMAASLYVASLLTGSSDVLNDHGYLATAIFLACAIGVFLVALRFDLSDPNRVTRRSDVAFWLHLAAAPALLSSMMTIALIGEQEQSLRIGGELTYGAAILVFLVIVVLMIVGVIIDRRAFVTSGLLSLIAAVSSLVSRGDLQVSSGFSIGLLVVGVIVLTIGIGWPHFRRLAFKLLPQNLKTKLPPLR